MVRNEIIAQHYLIFLPGNVGLSGGVLDDDCPADDWDFFGAALNGCNLRPGRGDGWSKLIAVKGCACCGVYPSRAVTIGVASPVCNSCQLLTELRCGSIRAAANGALVLLIEETAADAVMNAPPAG